jgi:hypothetical protein
MLIPKIIELFIEDQAFSLLYCLLYFQHVVAPSLSAWVSPVAVIGGRGGGAGVEAYDGEKAWPSINHSIFSDQYTIYIL